MELCSDKHEEVCFEGRDCPVCALRDELQTRIDELEGQVQTLEAEVDSLEEA